MGYFKKYYSCEFGTGMTRMGHGGVLATCNNETVRQENIKETGRQMTEEGQKTIYVNERCLKCPHYKER